jgi:hypothetical protein
MALEVEIVDARVELVDATAILLPVDGKICRLGGAVAGGLRAALAPDERIDEIDYVEHELARMRPLAHPQAKAIDGIARWSKIIVSAAYPHDVDGAVFSPDDCARMLRNALPVALALVDELALPTLAATLIGTAYRMPAGLAVRAFADGLAVAKHRAVRVRWSLPDAAHRHLAAAACCRLGLRATAC